MSKSSSSFATNSFSYSLTLYKYGCSKHSSILGLTYGLKTSILLIISIPSSPIPLQISFKFALGLSLNYFKYSKALPSVTKDKSSSVGVPITSKITLSQSFMFVGNPFFFCVGSDVGDKGKHDCPGKSGLLSKKVGAFSFIMDNSSAKIQPTDQISIASPQSFSNNISSGALYHLVTTWPVSYLYIFFLSSLVFTSIL